MPVDDDDKNINVITIILNHFHSAWELTKELRKHCISLLIEAGRLTTQSASKHTSNIESSFTEALVVKKWSKPSNTKKTQKGKQ